MLVPREYRTLCGGCRFARYCSKECQRAAWQTHKPHCAAIAQRRRRIDRAKGTYTFGYLSLYDFTLWLHLISQGEREMEGSP